MDLPSWKRSVRLGEETRGLEPLTQWRGLGEDEICVMYSDLCCSTHPSAS